MSGCAGGGVIGHAVEVRRTCDEADEEATVSDVSCSGL